MRIEAYNQVTQIYNSSRPSKVTGADGVRKKDQLQISQTGRDYQVAKQAVAASSDIRADKVTLIKNKMASGNYKVDAGDFAAKLIEKYDAYC
ncbi:MAG: flagellar biosynthesis anti-sigma factor FlgM [Lachnospiraceae bacterium]|jgi:negative regulator of flagellin synthesis FlgM|nr:flagellar biosynthesis anti-sigma factor FlgM [Lachnospiraceae bacterium]